jgi:hypothetical protein
MSQQIQITGGAKVRNLEGVLTGTAGVVNALGINVPSGIPQLDGSGKILVSQLPNSVMEYKGTWNAATNTPTLADGTGNQGDVYLCNVAGTANFGSGPIAFFVGDQVIYSGTIWQRASGATGTVTSVAVSRDGDALTITGSPITTSGTINIGFAGSISQYINGAGGLTTFPSLTGFVPYTGATANLDLGTFDLTTDIINLNQLKAIGSGGLNIYSNSGTHIALMGGGGGAGTTFYGGLIGTSASFTTSGGSDTFAINHSSGSGIALNITKGGNGEGLYINKTSGSGNAATIIGTLNATTLVKSGGTSSQFLKADGSVDATAYLPLSGGTLTGNLFLPANNTLGGTNFYIGQVVASNDYWRIYGNTLGSDRSEMVFQVGDNGQPSSTTGQRFRFFCNNENDGTARDVLIIDYNDSTFLTTLTANSFIKSGGTSSQFLKADGSVDSSTYLTTSAASSTYLPLSGGTLTGALNGTSASFSGKVGINATIASWMNAYSAMQLGGLTAIWNSDTNFSGYANNLYYDGSQYRYLTSTLANKFELGLGYFTWAGSPTGTAGNVATINEFMRLNASGNLGINTEAAIGSRLQVNGNVAIGFTTSTAAPTNGLAVAGAATFSSSVTAASLSLANTDGYLGTINSTSANGGYFEWRTSGTTIADIGTAQQIFGTGGNGTFGINARGARDLVFGTNNTERMRITSEGGLLVGTSTFSGYRAQFNGGDNYTMLINQNSGVTSSIPLTIAHFATSGTIRLIVFASGSTEVGSITTNGSTTSYNTTSDYRLKQDLKDYNALSLISSIKTYDYEWKHDNSRMHGVLAHELAEVLPYAVINEKDGEKEDGTIIPQGVDYSKLVPIMIKAIQELKLEIDELKNK